MTEKKDHGSVDRLLDVLRCPECFSGSLTRGAPDHLRCSGCGAQYPVIADVPYLLTSDVMEEHLEEDRSRPIEDAGPKSPTGGAVHWKEYGISELLLPPDSGRDVLLLGCGDAGEKPYLAELGYRPVGFDVRRSAGTDFVADAHRIPLDDSCFDLVISMQVLEHLRAPWVVAAEIGRILRPGGCFVGSVAFLKPFHHSFFHMTHSGVQELLSRAGLTVDYVAGAQSLTYTLGSWLIPFGGRRFRLALLGPFDRLLLGLRARFWAITRRQDPRGQTDRFRTGIPMSFRQFDKLRFAPAVVFRGRKLGAE
jgi:SAM-dependent methyltransferase